MSEVHDKIRELVEADEQGKQLQTKWSADGNWCDILFKRAIDRACYYPDMVRVKPKPVERLECFGQDIPWTPAVEYATFQRWPGDHYPIHMREVRPGDLTREEIEDRLEEFNGYAMRNFETGCIDVMSAARRIFLSEE